MSPGVGLGLGVRRGPKHKPRSLVAFVNLDGNSVLEGEPVGTHVGTLSVINGTGTYTYTLLDSAGGRFALDGSALEVGATPPTGPTHNVTVRADNGAGSVIDRTFTINVIPDEGNALDFSDADNSQYIPLILWG